MSRETVTSEYRFSRMTGRCANGAERDGGRRVHVVRGRSDWAPALCGAQPGWKGNGWSEHKYTEATCPRCIERLKKLTPVKTVLCFEGEELELKHG